MACGDFHFLQLLKNAREMLNSAVAPPTGVAGVLADLLEARPDDGVPCPELV